MKLYRSLKTNRITQKFGQNLNNFYAQLGLKGHNGKDYKAEDQEKIYFNCAIKGKVIALSNSLTAGIGVTALVQDGDKYYKLIYWHLKSYCVALGQSLKIGDLIGYADNTGLYTTGTHLHFGIYLSDSKGNTLKKLNGYGGAVDPDLFDTNDSLSALEAVEIMKKEIPIITALIESMKKLYKIMKNGR